MPYGNPDPAHPVKFIKGLRTPGELGLSPRHGARFFAKLLYEFWGFCINGGSSTTDPGGFPLLSGVNMPQGFGSDPVGLLATGGDGVTTFGSNVLSSAGVDFKAIDLQLTANSLSGTIVGKYVTIWRPGDVSPDDSVYRITGLTATDDLLVDVATAGTTRLGGKARFSDRGGIKFRVIDIGAVTATTGWGNNHHMVLNLAGAPSVNPGQAVSQVRLETARNQMDMIVTVSPSGTWNGSTFSDPSTPVTSTWFSTSSTGGQGSYMMIGGYDFLIAHSKGEDGAWFSSSGIEPVMHIEVPQRLYSSVVDPNPVCWFVTNTPPGQITGSYSNGFNMVCADGVTRNWSTLVRVPTAIGDHTHYLISPASGGLWHGFSKGTTYANAHFNAFSGTYISTDAMLMHSGVTGAGNQHCTSRVRLRRVRFTGKNSKPNMRLGQSWVHAGAGVLWPWDGSEVAYGIFPEGGGSQPGDYQG